MSSGINLIWLLLMYSSTRVSPKVNQTQRQPSATFSGTNAYRYTAVPSRPTSDTAKSGIRRIYYDSTSRLANRWTDESLHPRRTIGCSSNLDRSASARRSVRSSRFSVADETDWAWSTIEVDVFRRNLSATGPSVDNFDIPIAVKSVDEGELREIQREDSMKYSTIATGSIAGIHEGCVWFGCDPSPIEWHTSNEYNRLIAVRFDSTRVEDLSM